LCAGEGPCATTAIPAEADERGNPRASDGERCTGVAHPPAAGPPARLLDQRLELGDASFEGAIVLGLAERRRNGHGDSLSRMKLYLLAPMELY